MIVHEPATAEAQAWMRRRSGHDLLISDWVITEVSSALSLKLRTRAIDLVQRATALSAFGRLTVENFAVLPVLQSHFQTAAHFADRQDLGLRGGDALHLAICGGQGAALATLDRRMRDAALELGVSVEPL